MRMRLLPFLAFLFVTLGPPAQEVPEQSSRASAYSMAVRLDPETKTLHGTQKIRWTNTTSHSTSELRFHLYINAFKDLRSTHMQEAGEDSRKKWREGELGSIHFDELKLVEPTPATDLLARGQFISPDDGNADDRTVFRVTLPSAVAPGGAILLESRFTTKLPKAWRRTGWVPVNGVFCMHWFPKLGVLEDVGGQARWNCHQFHGNTEFFADYSRYEVAITVPAGHVIGATGGEPTGSPAPVDGMKTRTFVQERVHDFAWVADPDFHRYERTFGPVKAAKDPLAVRVAKEMGVPIEKFDLPETKIILLLQPEHDTDDQVQRHMEATQAAIRFFGLRFGPYPYRTITVVDPATDAMGNSLGGGMEYPTLITCGTSMFPHGRRKSPEGVTVHEFGHQYWYGLSGNNEFEESWLDEGINSYSEGRAQFLHYDAKMRPVQTSSFGLMTMQGTTGGFLLEKNLASLATLPLSECLSPEAEQRAEELRFDGSIIPRSPLLDWLCKQPATTFFREARVTDAWSDRDRWLRADNPDAMVLPGWLYRNRDSYRANSYHRPATLLRTLERMTGTVKWWSFLRKFHAAARFRHPTTAEFTDLLAKECGDQVARFFTAARGPQAVFDYGIDEVQPVDGGGSSKSVVVRRYGSLRGDVRVRFRFGGAGVVERTIHQKDTSPWWRFTFDDRRDGKDWGPLEEVWVDPPGNTPGTGEPFEGAQGPAGVYLIDQNLLNNGWRAQPDRRPSIYRGVRILLQTQAQLSFAGWTK